ncbi:hypothetical protein [Haloarchaeobius litoreus]|uniref:Uncharacterized protein n=1 Tax=Haloarchaeobius litoreus TaxID=755306 RepID=A0ABD6DJM6_9EURY|nr:hypothetical protein [Haloarchaeobius litoreus]
MHSEEFDYEGYLVYTPARAVHGDSDKFSQENGPEGWNLGDLPDFKPGTPKQPQTGFEKINFYDILDNYDIDPGVAIQFREMEYLRYKSESFSQESAYVEGDLREVYVRNIDSVDIFWFSTGLLLFRGTKKAVRKAIEDLQRIKKQELLIEDLPLSHGAVNQIYDKREILSWNSEIDYTHLHSVEFEGRDEISKMKISSLKDRGINTAKVTENAYPLSLEISVKIHGEEEIFVDIDRSRVHVRTSDGGLAELPPALRIAYSVTIAKEVGQLALKESFRNVSG